MKLLASGGFKRFLAGFALGLVATLALTTGGLHANETHQVHAVQNAESAA